jgi:hypothetical protein
MTGDWRAPGREIRNGTRASECAKQASNADFDLLAKYEAGALPSAMSGGHSAGCFAYLRMGVGGDDWSSPSRSGRQKPRLRPLPR